MTFSYALFYSDYYPDTSKAGTMFYFGISKDVNRPEKHLYEARNFIEINPYKNRVIRDIESYGLKVPIRYYHSHKTRNDACMYEIATIFLMPQLTNITIGGDNVMVERKHSLSSKQQIANSLIGNTRRLGCKHTYASIQKIKQYKPTSERNKKISTSLLGNTNSVGYKQSSEHVKKRVKSRLNKQSS